MLKQHVVLDLEMNPVAKSNREIRSRLPREVIEIGAVMIDEKNEVLDKFRCLVKPQYNAEIVPFITRLTGIATSDIREAVSFEEAIHMLEEWIGYSCETKIYSWSNSDLNQILDECEMKEVDLPENLKNWVDFQAVYPEVMGFDSDYHQMSLHAAAEQYGIVMDNKSSHSALYDAEITAELVIPVLTGEYKQQADLLKRTMTREENHDFTLGDACGGIFQQLLQQMQSEQELAFA